MAAHVSQCQVQYEEHYKAYENINKSYLSCEEKVNKAYKDLTEAISEGNKAIICKTGDWYQTASKELQTTYPYLTDMNLTISKIRELLLKSSRMLSSSTYIGEKQISDFKKEFNEFEQTFNAKMKNFNEQFEKFEKYRDIANHNVNSHNNEGGWVLHGFFKTVAFVFDVTDKLENARDTLRSFAPPSAYQGPTPNFSEEELKRVQLASLEANRFQPVSLESDTPVTNLKGKNRTKNVISDTLKKQ